MHALAHENIWLVHIISTIQTTFLPSKVSKTKLQFCFEFVASNHRTAIHTATYKGHQS